MSQNTIINSDFYFEKALAQCKGCYQRGLIEGRYALSGADLKGKARRYYQRYKKSRDNLLTRLSTEGIKWSEAVGPHNKRILIIG